MRSRIKVWILFWMLSPRSFLLSQSLELQKTPLVLKRVELTVQRTDTGKAALQTTLILPSTPGKHPLVLMTLGSEYFRGINQQVGPGMMQPQAIWFARRGWVVAVVPRRIYSADSGKMDKPDLRCNEASFAVRAEEEASDLTAVYDAVRNLAQVDGGTVIATGNSAGGFAALAFGAHAPPALKLVINFSGGWHRLFFAGTCARNGVIPAFRNLGATTHVPTLWLYARNDSLFGPTDVARMHDAFTSAGAEAEMPVVGKSGDEGHYLVSEGMSTWSPLVEDFLKRHDLPWQDLDPDYGGKPIKLPDNYPSEIKDAFLKWQKLGPNRAFAIGPNGAWGYASGRKTLKSAKDEALDRCRSSQCKIIAYDGS